MSALLTLIKQEPTDEISAVSSDTQQAEVLDQDNGMVLSVSTDGRAETLTGSQKAVNKTNDDNDFACTQCSKSFSSISSLNAHRRVHRGDNYFKCIHCKKPFSVMREYQKHIKTHLPEEALQCKLCGKHFPDIVALKQHMIIHDKIAKENSVQAGDDEAICTICGDKFSKYYIKYHMKIHTGDRPYDCSLCKRTFTHKQSLVAHQKIHKRKDVVHKCEICGRLFDYEYLLKRHNKIHAQYTCDQCGKLMTNKASLASHKRTHSIKISYQCEICKKDYSRFSAFVSHQEVHKGEDPSSISAECNGAPDVNPGSSFEAMTEYASCYELGIATGLAVLHEPGQHIIKLEMGDGPLEDAEDTE